MKTLAKESTDSTNLEISKWKNLNSKEKSKSIYLSEGGDDIEGKKICLACQLVKKEHFFEVAEEIKNLLSFPTEIKWLDIKSGSFTLIKK